MTPLRELANDRTTLKQPAFQIRFPPAGTLDQD